MPAQYHIPRRLEGSFPDGIELVIETAVQDGRLVGIESKWGNRLAVLKTYQFEGGMPGFMAGHIQIAERPRDKERWFNNIYFEAEFEYMEGELVKVGGKDPITRYYMSTIKKTDTGVPSRISGEISYCPTDVDISYYKDGRVKEVVVLMRGRTLKIKPSGPEPRHHTISLPH